MSSASKNSIPSDVRVTELLYQSQMALMDPRRLQYGNEGLLDPSTGSEGHHHAQAHGVPSPSFISQPLPQGQSQLESLETLCGYFSVEPGSTTEHNLPTNLHGDMGHDNQPSPTKRPRLVEEMGIGQESVLHSWTSSQSSFPSSSQHPVSAQYQQIPQSGQSRFGFVQREDSTYAATSKYAAHRLDVQTQADDVMQLQSIDSSALHSENEPSLVPHNYNESTPMSHLQSKLVLQQASSAMASSQALDPSYHQSYTYRTDPPQSSGSVVQSLEPYSIDSSPQSIRGAAHPYSSSQRTLATQFAGLAENEHCPASGPAWTQLAFQNADPRSSSNSDLSSVPDSFQNAKFDVSFSAPAATQSTASGRFPTRKEKLIVENSTTRCTFVDERPRGRRVASGSVRALGSAPNRGHAFDEVPESPLQEWSPEGEAEFIPAQVELEEEIRFSADGQNRIPIGKVYKGRKQAVEPPVPVSPRRPKRSPRMTRDEIATSSQTLLPTQTQTLSTQRTAVDPSSQEMATQEKTAAGTFPGEAVKEHKEPEKPRKKATLKTLSFSNKWKHLGAEDLETTVESMGGFEHIAAGIDQSKKDRLKEKKFLREGEKMAKTAARLKECPFCCEPWPKRPSHRLTLEMQPWLDQINSVGLHSIEPTEVVPICKLHESEKNVIPEGKLRGWPTVLDVDELEKRIQQVSVEEHLHNVIRNPGSSHHFITLKKAFEMNGNKAMSGEMAFEQLERERAGYYGERGWEVMFRVLMRNYNNQIDPSQNVFASDRTAAEAIHPLNGYQYLTGVMIPELCCFLIAQDVEESTGFPCTLDEADLVRIESIAYGSAMFPIENSVEDYPEASQGTPLNSQKSLPQTQQQRRRGGAGGSSAVPSTQNANITRKTSGKVKKMGVDEYQSDDSSDFDMGAKNKNASRKKTSSPVRPPVKSDDEDSSDLNDCGKGSKPKEKQVVALQRPKSSQARASTDENSSDVPETAPNKRGRVPKKQTLPQSKVSTKSKASQRKTNAKGKSGHNSSEIDSDSDNSF